MAETTEAMLRAQVYHAHRQFCHPCEELGWEIGWPVWRSAADLDPQADPFDICYIAVFDNPTGAVALAAWLSGPTLWDVAPKAAQQPDAPMGEGEDG
jgi:hypothetical protein